jgi:hypothetical protein
MNFEVKFFDIWTCSIRENMIYIGYWDNDLQQLNSKSFVNMKSFRSYLDTHQDIPYHIRDIFEHQYISFQQFFKLMHKLGEE